MDRDFRYNKYIPVLRWKAAEVDAFFNLDASIKDQTMPLFELCPTMFIRKKKINDLWIKEKLPISTLSKKLIELKGAVGKLTFYMDLINVIDSSSPYSNQLIWEKIIEYGKLIRLPLVPVTGFYNKGKENQQLIGSVGKEFRNGVSVRLNLQDLSRRSFHSDLEQLLSLLDSQPQEIDLMIDLQILKEGKTTYSYSAVEQRLSVIDKWRSITLLAGSFPKDLGFPMEANNTYEVPRLKWLKWVEEILSGKSFKTRTPRFGDFTIQHALYKEPPDAANVSASIRYTHDNHWIVIRGEALGKEGGIGHDQYPAEAQLLIDKKEYHGSNYSEGAKIIMQKAQNGSNPGTPETWLMVGINHHITHTVYQLHPELLVAKQKEEAKLKNLVGVQQKLL